MSEDSKYWILFFSMLAMGGLSLLTIGLTSGHIEKFGFEIESLGSYALGVGFGYLSYGLYKIIKEK